MERHERVSVQEGYWSDIQQRPAAVLVRHGHPAAEQCFCHTRRREEAVLAASADIPAGKFVAAARPERV